MANQSSDRQRMSNELRELAKLAKPASGVHGSRFPTTTEGSGYFDLEALLATEAARSGLDVTAALGAAAPAVPRPAGRPIDVPSHERMAPVAFEPRAVPQELRPAFPARRGRRAVYALFSVASVGVVGYLALTLARHPPPPAAAAPETTAAAVVPAGPAADPAPQPATTPAAAAPTASPPAAAGTDSTTSAAAAVTPTPGKPSTKTPPPPGAHIAAAAPPAHAAAAHPAVIPASQPARGNDSLMDLIKKSVSTGK
jgi:hypothetical protein